MDQERLIAGYLDGSLSDAEREELDVWLKADSANLLRFTEAVIFDQQIRAVIEADEARTAGEAFHGASRGAPALPRRVPWLRWPALAATAAAVMLIGLVAKIWFGSQRVPTAPANDPYLAIVIDQSPVARWSGKDAPRGVGHALGRGRCRLESGEATLQLDNGVELQLRAPADLELHSVDHGILYRGFLSTRVPPGATGFRVDAPGLNVVDLGTEFSVAVDGSGQPKVHVFKGKVRAGLPAVPASRTELTTGESARFDVDRGTVRLGPENPALFPALPDDGGIPQTTGDVRYLRRAPESVRPGTFEHNAIMVFEERADAALPEALTVVRGASNQQDGPEPSVPEKIALPAGTRVRSYYVHFDRVGKGARDVESKGSITFDRPVLGLVIPFMTLKQTDAWLAHAGTTYETGPNRILEMRFMGWKQSNAQHPNTSGRFDEVRVDPDGRTVTMDLLTGWEIDQVRVLVMAKDQ